MNISSNDVYLLKQFFMIILFPYLLALCFILTSCEGSGIADITAGKEYELYDYYIDKNGEEGIVIYIDSGKNETDIDYILVMSLDETECIWSKTGVSIANNDKSIKDYYEVGLFLNQRAYYLGLEKFPAFKWCIDKNRSKKYPDINSWVLPSLYHHSKHIPSLLRENQELINHHIENYGGIPLDPEAYYWVADEPSMVSTSEPVSDLEYSLIFSMTGNYYTAKEALCRARAFKCILLDKSL